MTTEFALSGRMFYPPTGMKNFSKHKPVLDKLAKYTGGANEKYLMLMKIFTVNKCHPDHLISTYNEKFELWEVKSVNLPALEDLLRDEAIAMCEHNLNKYLDVITDLKNETAGAFEAEECDLEKKVKSLFTLSPQDKRFAELRADNEEENDWFRRRAEVAGTCTRAECRNISLETLLQRFLQKKIPTISMDGYKTISEISGYSYERMKKEFGIETKPVFEHELKEGESYSVTKIKQTKLRGLSDSNGKEAYEFQVLLCRDSNVERLKNTLRPLAFKAKRASVQRSPIIHRFAHTDKSVLERWRSTLDKSLIKDSVSSKIADKVVDTEDHIKEVLKKDLENTKADSDTNAFRIEKKKTAYWKEAHVLFNPRSERGQAVEVMTAYTYLPFDILDLFYLMVPLESSKNTTSGQSTSYFENYLFGPNCSPEKQLMFYSLDPPMMHSNWSENFGKHLQSILVMNQRIDRIKRHGDSSSGFISYFRDSWNDYFLNPPDLNKYIVHNRKNGHQFFSRNFNLKKEYWTTSSIDSPMSDFGIVYSDCQVEENLDKRKVAMGDKGFQAKLGRLYLKFESNQVGAAQAKDKLRERALDILSQKILSEAYSMNDEGLTVQWYALRTIGLIMKGNRNPDYEARVLDLLKTIITVKILNVRLVKSPSVLEIIEKRMTVHKLAVEILVQIVEDRVNMGRIDTTILLFLKSALTIVEQTKTDKCKDALKVLKSLCRKCIKISKKEKTRRIMGNIVYQRVQDQAASLERLMAHADAEEAYIEDLRVFFAQKDEKERTFDRKVKEMDHGGAMVERIPYILIEKVPFGPLPIWVEADYNPDESMYIFEEEQSKDIKTFNIVSPKRGKFNASHYQSIITSYEKKMEVVTVNPKDNNLDMVERSKKQTINIVYGKLEKIRDDVENHNVSYTLTLPKGMDAKKNIPPNIDDVGVFESGKTKNGLAILTLRGPQKQMQKALKKVEREIKKTLNKLKKENPKKIYNIPEPVQVVIKDNEHFLVKAMAEIQELVNTKWFADEDPILDQYLQVEILDLISKLLMDCKEKRTKVTISIENSAKMLWGPAMDVLQKTKVYQEEILDSIGKALVDLDFKQ